MFEFQPKPASPLKCSFCDEVESESRYVVTAPHDINICNECIELAKLCVEDQREQERRGLPRNPSGLMGASSANANVYSPGTYNVASSEAE